MTRIARVDLTRFGFEVEGLGLPQLRQGIAVSLRAKTTLSNIASSGASAGATTSTITSGLTLMNRHLRSRRSRWN